MKTTTTFACLVALPALAICFALALTSIFTSTAQAADVTFDWATVGNPGNTPDTESHERWNHRLRRCRQHLPHQ